MAPFVSSNVSAYFSICWLRLINTLAEGISIPSSYTAHLAPLSSSKLYNEARAGKDEKSLETPYVVMFSAINLLSGDGGGLGGRCGPQVQECWEFEHPRKDAVLDKKGDFFPADICRSFSECIYQDFHRQIVITHARRN